MYSLSAKIQVTDLPTARNQDPQGPIERQATDSIALGCVLYCKFIVDRPVVGFPAISYHPCQPRVSSWRDPPRLGDIYRSFELVVERVGYYDFNHPPQWLSW